MTPQRYGGDKLLININIKTPGKQDIEFFFFVKHFVLHKKEKLYE
jgi:hypothetical protein